MGQWVQDPVYGGAVWQDDDGKVNLVDRAGAVVRVAPQNVADRLLDEDGDGPRYRPATDRDIAAYDERNRAAEADARRVAQGGIARKVGTVVENAAKGAYDATTALPRAALAAGLGAVGQGATAAALERDVLSGEAVASNLGAVFGEAFGGDRTGEAVARELDDERRQRAQDAPGIAMAGRWAGDVASAIATGGVSTLVGKGLARAGASKGFAAVAGLAVEGGALGVTQAAENAFVADADLTAEAMLESGGMGLLFGGGIGGAGYAAGRGLSRMRAGRSSAPSIARVLGDAPDVPPQKALEEALRTATGETPSPRMVTKLREWLVDAQEMATGPGNRDILERASPLRWDDDAVRIRDVLRNKEQYVAQASDDMSRAMEDLIETGELTRARWGSIEARADDFAPLLDASEESLRVAVRQSADDVLTLADDLAAIDGVGGKSKRIRDLVAHSSRTFDTLADDGADVAAKYAAVNRLKANLQRNVVDLGKTIRVAATDGERVAASQTREALEAVQERLRKHLESDAWGSAGKAQKAVNQHYSESLRSSRVVREDMMREVERVQYEGPAKGLPKYDAAPEKIQGYLTSVGRGPSSTDKYVRANIEAQRNMGQALVDSFGEASELGKYGRQQLEAAVRAQKAIGKVDDVFAITNKVDDLAEAQNKTTGLLGNIGAGSGAILGGVVGGPIGAAVGAAAGMVGQMVARPADALYKGAAMVHVVQRLRGRIQQGARRVLSATTPSEASAGRLRRGAGLALRAAPHAAVAAMAERYDAAAESVQDAASAPETIISRISDAMGAGAPDAFPKTSAALATTAVKAAKFLENKLPVPAVARTLFGDPPGAGAVADTDMQRFLRYYDAVTAPVETMLDGLADGSLTHEHVDALREVWPAVFGLGQSVILEEAAQLTTPPPYDVQTRIARLWGLGPGVVPTLDPGLQARLQGYAAQQEQPQGGPPRGGGSRGPSKIASAYQSRISQLAGGIGT